MKVFVCYTSHADQTKDSMNLAIGDLPQRKRQNCHSLGNCSKIMVILHLQGDPQNYGTNEMTLEFLHLHLTSTSNKWDSQSKRNVFTSCPFTLGVHQTAPRRSSIFATSGKLRRLLQKSKWLFNNLGARGCSYGFCSVPQKCQNDWKCGTFFVQETAQTREITIDFEWDQP